MKRLGAYCKLEMVELAEEKIDEKAAGEAVIREALDKEAKRILAAVPKGAVIAALCVEGRGMTSEGLAAWMQQQALAGQGDIAFVVGSSHGLGKAVKEQAALKLSLSAMTLPHQLARLVLAEQIYRAYTIQAGGKYHK